MIFPPRAASSLSFHNHINTPHHLLSESGSFSTVLLFPEICTMEQEKRPEKEIYNRDLTWGHEIKQKRLWISSLTLFSSFFSLYRCPLSWDPQKRPPKETYQRDHGMRPSKETNQRGHKQETYYSFALPFCSFSLYRFPLLWHPKTRPMKETYSRDEQKDPSERPDARDLQKRPYKKTCKRDLINSKHETNKRESKKRQ